MLCSANLSLQCKSGEVFPCYYQVETEVQVAQVASLDTQGKSSSLLLG